MNKLKILSLYLLIIILSACSVNNKYRNPKIDLPKNYNSLSEPVSNKESMGTIKWDDFFKDETLKTFINKALQDNFDINIAAKNLAISEKYFKQSKLNYFPNINLAISGTDTISNNSSSYNLNTGLQTSWEIDLWGKLRANEQALLSQYLQTAAGKQALQTQIIAQVAKEYYHLYLLNDKLNTLKKYQTLADSTVKIMQLQFDVGNSTYLGLQQSIAQKLTVDKMLPEVEQNIVMSENAINFLIGQFPSKITVQGNLQEIVANNYLIGVPADLLRYRPDLQKAEYALREASARANVALKEMYPNFTITANGGVQLLKNSVWFNIPNAIFAIADVGVLQPIFNNRKLKTKYEIALIEREKAVISFKESVVNAVMEVSNALIQVNKLKEAQKIVKDKVEILTKAVENARLLFLMGQANYLEVITSQNNLINAEIERITLKEQYIYAAINLYTALGGGSINQ